MENDAEKAERRRELDELTADVLPSREAMSILPAGGPGEFVIAPPVLDEPAVDADA